jgi:hypothetical protein
MKIALIAGWAEAVEEAVGSFDPETKAGTNAKAKGSLGGQDHNDSRVPTAITQNAPNTMNINDLLRLVR